MSDYSEHLISMAGGDGEADVLGEIEARANDPFGTSMQGIGQVDADRDTLLAIVREQRAVIERVRAEAWGEGHAHYGKYFSPNFPEFGVNPYRTTPDAS